MNSNINSKTAYDITYYDIIVYGAMTLLSSQRVHLSLCLCNIDGKLTTDRHAVLRPDTRLARATQAVTLVVSKLVDGNLTSDGQEKSALLVVVVGGMQEKWRGSFEKGQRAVYDCGCRVPKSRVCSPKQAARTQQTMP